MTNSRCFFALLLLLFQLLGGCASSHEKLREIEAKRVALHAVKPESDGLVLLSIGTQSVHPFRLVQVRIRPVGQGSKDPFKDLEVLYFPYRLYPTYEVGAKASLDMGSHVAQDVFSTSTSKGIVFLTTLPEGDYEIFHYEMVWRQLLGRDFSIPLRQHISIPFTVRKGEIAYLGRFEARITGLETAPGLIFDGLKPERVFFDVSYRLDDDLKLVQSLGNLKAQFRLPEDRRPILCGQLIFRCGLSPITD